MRKVLFSHLLITLRDRDININRSRNTTITIIIIANLMTYCSFFVKKIDS